MAKFAIYYVPPADSELYQRGSEILGYDVRQGIFLPDDNITRQQLPEFDAEWVAQPQTYGFHVTTGYSLYYDPAVLPQIEQEMENLLSCFGADVSFKLIPAQERIKFWSDTICVLHCEPNPPMLMLHTMLTARINPFGTASNVSKKYDAMPPAEMDPVKASRVRQYYTPYMLDGWTPHFTLMMPYTGTQRTAMHQTLLGLFPADEINVESICLLVRDDDETHYRLHREFIFTDYP